MIFIFISYSVSNNRDCIFVYFSELRFFPLPVFAGSRSGASSGPRWASACTGARFSISIAPVHGLANNIPGKEEREIR